MSCKTLRVLYTTVLYGMQHKEYCAVLQQHKPRGRTLGLCQGPALKRAGPSSSPACELVWVPLQGKPLLVKEVLLLLKEVLLLEVAWRCRASPCLAKKSGAIR